MMSDDALTAEEQAALDAQRDAPEPEAPAQTESEVPQEAATEGESQSEGEQPPAADKRPQMVPHAALHEERERRKEVERQAAEDRRKWEARYEALIERINQPEAPKPAEPAALPDYNQDPAGYIVANMQRQGATQEQVLQRLAAFEQQQQQQQVIAAVQQRTAAMETAYKAEHPEYEGAFDFMRSFRDRQLQAAGMMDPAQRAQQVASEWLQMSAMTLQQGGNPAERLHRIAEASGWRPAEAPAPHAAADPAAPAAPTQAERIQMVQRGQEHARGLGGVRGNGPSPMTAAKLLDMDDNAFLEAMKNSKEARKLMGA